MEVVLRARGLVRMHGSSHLARVWHDHVCEVQGMAMYVSYCFGSSRGLRALCKRTGVFEGFEIDSDGVAEERFCFLGEKGLGCARRPV